MVGDAVEPESLPISYGFFVSRRRSQFIYSLHVDQHSTFHTVSPFLVQKLLTSCIGEIQNVKKLRSGDLLVQVDSKQASVISKLTHLEAEFLEELRDQNVCAARRINIRRDGRLIPTQHVVLTFQTPVLPKSIKAGYINCKLRPYIPNPLRCFKCQRYGHSQQSCRGTDPVCGKCAESGHETNVCPDTFKCRNCSGPHVASSKSCPTWIFEKEVIAVKIKRNITFPEARQIVQDRTPKVGVSYSSTVQMQPKISNNTSEISSMQLPVSIPLSTLPSKFFTAPTATTSMKNNSPKKSKQPTPSTSKMDIVKNKKKLKPLENSSKKTLDAKQFLKSNTSSESDMELDSSSAYRNITKMHPVCIALQETYLKPADIAKIKRYSLVRKDNENESGRASGGVALLVSHDTPSSVITLHTNLQAVAVRVMFSNLVTICTQYLPPSTSVDERDLNRLVDELLLLLSFLGILMVIAHCGAVRIQIFVDDKLRSLLILTLFAYLTMEKTPTSINEVELSTLWTSHYARRLLLVTLTLELELTCVTVTISQFFWTV
ncbi:hypothetical protein AVEN_241327-1 [Araneus ventricosus]|uniref:CCHC-type domain-containing protein n=1 Tax=Araneus ventricosus TaxID=182803 RepID=A0A4Y2ECM4_ARAVE|nr:hypothetical protein AVEN_241327-1 [Araneus ventricosus]